MQIKRRAESTPKIEGDHDRQIGKMKTREESDDAQNLDCNQDRENEEIELFVFKHAVWQEAASGPHSRNREHTLRWKLLLRK